MKTDELRNKFLNFFKKKGHVVIPSASLLPENDPTSLFISAGMQPLVPYLMGEKHPEGVRLANLQRCVRTGDIDEVGDESHLTFFEMMGYWSLGDYWKKAAIEYIFEFLTKELGLDPKNFAATCFEGDEKNGIPRDMESYEIWRSLGIPKEKIAFLGYKDNWWGPAGDTGPCGPDSELFVWAGEGEAPKEFNPENKGWMELCNDVFMEYDRDLTEDGWNKSKEGRGLVKDSDFEYNKLSQKNVDFGMGFERLLAYLNKESDIYKTELFWPIVEKIEELFGRKYKDNKKEYRIIADHLKAAVYILNDGVLPSNKDQGYVVRRLIRRAIARSFFALEINKSFSPVIETVIDNDSFLVPNASNIKRVYDEEECRYAKTVKNGIELIKNNPGPTAELIFDLEQSYGIYTDISIEGYKHYHNIEIDKSIIEKVNALREKHKELSRTASAGMFKGGLADAGRETKKLHTAAHLMLEALRRVLGNHVVQKGSNITAERLRFDFSHPEKMTDGQIKQVEDIVNEQIKKDLQVSVEEITTKEAEKKGATGAFRERYKDKVKVYSIGNTSGADVYSKEICGGPHVKHTGELGHFKIIKEQSSSLGVRRIKAVLK